MADNLLTIGTSGVLASTGLLNTTGNNISNLNSKGYVRQSTEYQSSILGLGVGRGFFEGGDEELGSFHGRTATNGGLCRKVGWEGLQNRGSVGRCLPGVGPSSHRIRYAICHARCIIQTVQKFGVDYA